jgi:3D (Asp-Asp-Asp) domain-containing protein
VTAHGDEENRPNERRRRTSKLLSLGGALGLLGIGTAATVGVHPMWRRMPAHAALPVVVVPAAPRPAAPLRLGGALVQGAARDWAVGRKKPLGTGVPVPVQLTAYCLQGTTRRDRVVREGIVAADPRLFPLGRYVEVYVGRKYHGRFLVDDTGGVNKNGNLDIWTPSCREARRFGRQHGTAVLVARPRGARDDTLLTGRLGGLAAK